MDDPTVVVVLSGGLDSTVLAHKAVAKHGSWGVMLLSVDYGQRHASRELAAARLVGQKLLCRHDIVDLTGLTYLLPGSALTDDEVAVPDGHYADASMRVTVVPARNAIFLSVAAGYAVSHGASEVWIGAHAGDHPIYPDCRPEFVDAMARALRIGTEGLLPAPFGIRAPFVGMTKADIVREGARLEARMDLTWSCYKGGSVHCGTCGTCVERREAFKLAGVADPTVYAE